MDSIFQNPQSPGPSMATGKGKEPSFMYSPLSPPPPPQTGHVFGHTPRSFSETLAHPSSHVTRTRNEIQHLTDNERLRVEWEILLRKKDKYKSWKKRIKDEWREVGNAKVLMEANRQRLREDE